uniref:Uncharacterized protein n=1 Tax=Tetranychus urticae TaxID=32264 RepID=T1KC38_TETUR
MRSSKMEIKAWKTTRNELMTNFERCDLSTWASGNCLPMVAPVRPDNKKHKEE